MWKLGTPESQQTAPAASSQPHSGGFQLHTFLLPQKESCRLRPLEISHTDPPKQAPKPPESQGTYRLPLGMKVILKQTRSSRLPSLRAGNLGDWHTFRGTASGGAQPGPRGQRAGGSPQRCQELSCASGPDQSRLGSCGWSCLPGSVLVFCWPQLCRQSPDKASTWRTKEAGRRGSARDATGWSP